VRSEPGGENRPVLGRSFAQADTLMLSLQLISPLLTEGSCVTLAR
jgi:hypothetical protein